MTSYDNEDAIVVTEPTDLDVNPTDSTQEDSRGVSGPVVNNSAKESETPSDLVAPSDEAGKLSPNPAGFGFTKQLIVDPDTYGKPNASGEPNTLYLVKVINNGALIGYRLFKWTPTDGFEQFGATPDLKLEDGPRETPVKENNPPREAPEKVFYGDVVFINEPIIKGKKLSEYIDSEGGVTEAELQAALALKQDLLNTTSAPAGSAVKLIGFDSDGHLVSDELPAGIVVDDSLNTESDNAIANKPVAEKFAEVDAGLETKANVDGNYPTMTVGVADQLSPYDDESGDDQDEPFILQATGTGNGTQPDFATGAIALMKEKQGNTVVVNQLLNSFNSANVNYGTVTTSSGVVTYKVIEAGTTYQHGIRSIEYITKKQGHKYLIEFDAYTNGSSIVLGFDILNVVSANIGTATTSKKHFCAVLEGQSNNNVYICTRSGAQVDDEIYFSNIHFVDLTQWFNGDIPADLIAHPENFFRYYQGSLAYNTGELVNANGRYIKCIGMNQWDEEWEVGRIGASSGENANTGYDIRSKNYIKVIPNTTYCLLCPPTGGIFYYDVNNNYIGTSGALNTKSTFTTPSNCVYIRFCTYQGSGYITYNHDISINLYYEDEARCLTYEPYEVLTNNDTGTEVLRSAGNVKDIKLPSGEITRRIGVVDLGTLEWSYSSTSGYLFATVPGIKNVPTYSIGNGLISKYYTFDNFENMYNDTIDKTIALTNGQGNERIYIRDSAYTDAPTFKTAMSGVYLFYELAEPTTEQGTPYSENLVIDDFGSMDFQGTNGVPQGALIFYPVDYKAFIDTLYNYTDGTPSNIALKSDLSADKSELQGVDSQLQNAIGGTLRQLLASSQSVDFLNTDFVDLGTLTYVKNGNRFEAYFNLAKYTFNEKPNILSTAFKTDTWVNVYNASGDKLISIIDRDSNAGKIAILDSSYNSADTTTFKNAMKGVLLAYEKGE